MLNERVIKMTKKLVLIAIASLFVFATIGTVLAEQSASVYGGKKYYEQQVFVDAYNNTGGTLPVNSVVILDTTGTAADSLGAYITTSTTAGSVYIFGVVAQATPITNATGTLKSNLGINTATTGRICVRGPHLVRVSTASTVTAGNILTQSGTAGVAYPLPSSTVATGILGVALESAGTQVWTWIRPVVSQ
jgi:glutamate synthase domain-containing protein 3